MDLDDMPYGGPGAREFNKKYKGPFQYTAIVKGVEYKHHNPGGLKVKLRKQEVSSPVIIRCNGEFSMMYKPQLSRRKGL